MYDNMLVMNILLLVGSGDADSHSLHLGQTIEAALAKRGATTELINLVEYGLPVFNRSVERNDSYDELTRTFLDKSQAADAYVWITPIYHNSFSGILKNALDWQHSKFPNKVVGMASHGGHRSPQAVDHLMHIARAQHGVSIRTRVCTEDGDYDDKLTITDDSILRRIEDFADELTDLTRRFQ